MSSVLYINTLFFMCVLVLEVSVQFHSLHCFRNMEGGVREMTQWVKVLAAKLEDQSSIPGTHTLKREN